MKTPEGYLGCALCNRVVYDADVDDRGYCCFCEDLFPRTDSGREALPDGSTIPPEEPDQPAPTLSSDKGDT